MYTRFKLFLFTGLLLAGCSEQEGSDWYDQSVEHTQERDDYIQHQIGAGLSPEEARKLHDIHTYEQNTINMTREGMEPEL